MRSPCVGCPREFSNKNDCPSPCQRLADFQDQAKLFEGDHLLFQISGGQGTGDGCRRHNAPKPRD